MDAEADRIAAITDPFALFKAATDPQAEVQRKATELCRPQQRMITELHRQALSYADTPPQAPAAESAFLGTSRVIIATPLKREAANARPDAGVDSTPQTNNNVAYLGRLPRPDRQGLTLMRIHPKARWVPST